MAFLEAHDLCFRYREDLPTVINGVSLSIEKGSFTAIIGHNGSGKSTLAKLLCGMLAPTSGYVEVAGMRTDDEEREYDIRKKCGMVFQNPDNQIVASVVEEDVAFAPENLGVPSAEIRARVDEVLAAVGMTEYAKHSTYKLSGGQKQRVAIAGILAMEPECIIFDESTSMLDPSGQRDIVETMKKLNREKGMTVISITHHMNEAVEADRVLVMNEGRITADGTPLQVFSQVERVLESHLAVPQVTELMYKLGKAGKDTPTDVLHAMEAADKLEKLIRSPIPYAESDVENGAAKPDAALKLENVTVRYGAGTPFEKVALKDINVEFPKGKITGIIGHTGSGKSTLAMLLNGLLKPESGTVYLEGEDINQSKQFTNAARFKVGLVFQYPEYQLFEDTVKRDIAFGPRNMGLGDEETEERVSLAARFCGIDGDTLGMSPFEISGGQKRRAAIAGVIAMRPQVLVLDEPAAGLDPQGKEEIFRGLCGYRDGEGATMLLISHSMEDVARYSDNIVVLKEGEIFMQGTPQEIFANAEKLFSASLDVPQITRLFLELKKRAKSERCDIYTVDYAVKTLLPYVGPEVGE
ncbi:MAG: energy-coupling factor transporter ATPase [Clostridia bacterium]|nr:energy-coupling factor transporter ATPase [Clostridia bacterium]